MSSRVLLAAALLTACASSEGPPGAPTDASMAGDPDGAPADAGRGPGDAGDPDASSPLPILPCPAISGVVTMQRDSVRVDYDLATGNASFFAGGARKVQDFYAGVQLGSYTTSRAYSSRSCVVQGDVYTITLTGNGLPLMEHLFVLNGGHKFLTRVIVRGEDLESSWMAPVVMDTPGGVDVGSQGDPRLLWIPFDNDAWVSYNALPMSSSGTSYEAAVFFDNQNRHGIVVGSVTHDTWKTGVYYQGSNDRLDALNVFGGAVDATWTHDRVPHGKVKGDVIYSPIVFVGYADDWRDLLEEYAEANLAFEGRLEWNGSVPFGWNSWGKIQTALSYDKAIAVSDYIKHNLQRAGFGEGTTVYVNLDSYWDNLSEAQLADFVARTKANGQKAGIYWAPFVDWGKQADRVVEGSSFTYGQMWLRDGNSNPIELDGAYAIDPTHPAARARIDHYVDRFKSWGFEYLKLDFLTHGALESTVRSDATVHTGIQAYHRGMKYLRDRVAGSMFLSLSIAPLFPYQYGHARRVACDTYGAATGDMSSQYLLNSVTYGWWMSGRLYPYNDPDHMVFEGFGAGDNMVRLISAVISGTVFLNGDDLTRPAAQALAKAYLTNPRINQVARRGRSFRPLDGASGTASADVFVLADGDRAYLAVFNFGGGAVTRSIDLARAGLSASQSYAVTDLWTGTTTSASGTLSVPLEAGFARLFELE
jgi:alpha-galactosidase